MSDKVFGRTMWSVVFLCVFVLGALTSAVVSFPGLTWAEFLSIAPNVAMVGVTVFIAYFAYKINQSQTLLTANAQLPVIENIPGCETFNGEAVCTREGYAVYIVKDESIKLLVANNGAGPAFDVICSKGVEFPSIPPKIHLTKKGTWVNFPVGQEEHFITYRDFCGRSFRSRFIFKQYTPNSQEDLEWAEAGKSYVILKQWHWEPPKDLFVNL